MLERPKALLFDMGGVLLESADMWDVTGFAKSYPEGLPEGISVQWFLDMSHAIIQAFTALPDPRPAMDARPIIREWLPRAGIDNSPENVERWHSILTRWEVRPLYPFVYDTLSELHRRGFRIGLISNTLLISEGHRALFREQGIYDFFEFMVFSAEFGINKPHPSIFMHALDSMKLSAKEAWYIGDKPHRDVCGAHGVGMKAVLVDSIYESRVNDAPENAPDFRIRDIRGLSGILG